MERGNRGKRAREGDDAARDSSGRGAAAKKPDLPGTDKEQSFNNILHAYDEDRRVFDFPWLNKSEGGTMFKAAEEEEDTLFASFSSLHQMMSSAYTVGFEFSGGQQYSCQSQNWLVNFQDEKIINEDGDEGLANVLSLEADELEGADWIWSSMPDQPLPLADKSNGLNEQGGL